MTIGLYETNPIPNPSPNYVSNPKTNPTVTDSTPNSNLSLIHINPMPLNL